MSSTAAHEGSGRSSGRSLSLKNVSLGRKLASIAGPLLRLSSLRRGRMCLTSYWPRGRFELTLLKRECV